MSTTSTSLAQTEPVAGTLVGVVGRALKNWWIAYLNWRLDRLAISRLGSMSDRELKDIGVARSSIEFAVRSGSGRKPLFPLFY